MDSGQFEMLLAELRRIAQALENLADLKLKEIVHNVRV